MRDKSNISFDTEEIFFIIIIGMSGAGKSCVLNSLEDCGFYCVDNLPPELIPSLYRLCLRDNEGKHKVAVVTNLRSEDVVKRFFATLDELNSKGLKHKILYLDADDSTLVNRYKETRRTHPLDSLYSSLEICVKKERKFVSGIKDISDFNIDSSHLSSLQLKQRINMLFTGDESGAFSIRCVAFGFKYGIPHDADLVFDTRCFPNPFYIKELKNLTGLDKEVSDYVFSFSQTREFLNKLFSLVDYMLPLYQSEGKSSLVIAIGCTGGRHRSVAITEKLSEHLIDNKYRSLTFNRDIDRIK